MKNYHDSDYALNKFAGGKTVKRGEVYYADLSPIKGSEQGGFRPVLIISNDIGNRNSPTVIVAAVSSKAKKIELPTHCPLPPQGGLPLTSIVMLEQVRTIDKLRLERHICTLDESTMEEIDRGLAVSLGIKKSNTERTGDNYAE